MLFTRPSSLFDGVILSQKLRKADLREIEAATTSTPSSAVVESIKASAECHSICTTEGDLVAIYGVVDAGNGVGIVWMLASDDLLNHRREFLRKSRERVDDLLTRYRILCNLTDSRNIEHHRWIRWCGFTFTGIKRVLRDPSVPFLEFHKQCVSDQKQPSSSQPSQAVLA